jgi:subtilisin family serine protease
MSRTRSIVLGLSLLVTAVAPSPAAGATTAGSATEPTYDVIVKLRAKADLERLPRTGSQRVRRARVINELRATATRTQDPFLRAVRRAGGISSVRPLWISNSVAIRATQRAIDRIRARPEVLSVTPDRVFLAPEAPTSTTPEPNLTQVNAPALWDRGITGQNVVVALLDTGVDVDHPDLNSSWRGGTNSWFDPFGEHRDTPTDINGHGTWTAGVAVGGSTGGTAIGMAPGARWISARIFDDRGRGTTSAIHAALQWVADPDHNPATDDAADVVSNSWGFSGPGCDLEFQQDLAALRGLDILPVFSAGNSGPTAGTSYSPANYPEAFSVGAVDSSDQVLGSSSRGPSGCGGRTRSFPDVVAPGNNIYSSDLYSLWTVASGTSMAAPHTAGALALLLSGRPGLSAAEQEAVLRSGAYDLGPAGPDETYGAGRLDTLAAWTLAEGIDTVGPTSSGVSVSPDPTDLSTPPTVSATIDDTATGGSTVVAAEAFVDSVGTDGTGIPLTLATTGTPSTTARGTLGTSYSEGRHTIHVHGQDAAGRWGSTASASFLVDRLVPVIGTAAVSPNPTAGAGQVTVTATASDAGGVAALSVVEEGNRVPVFNGTMAPTDGSFGGTQETARVTLATTGWSPGQHLLSIRARDVAGHWSVPTRLSLLVGSQNALFGDGFETGGINRWTRSSGGTRLSVTKTGAPVGSAALRVAVSQTTVSYVEDASPVAEPKYRARFWFDPQATPTGTGGHDILIGLNTSSTVLFRVAYRRTSTGQLQLRTGARTGATQAWSAWSAISAGQRLVELRWAAGNPGNVQLLVDGVVKSTLSGLSNSTLRLATVRLGPSSGSGSAAAGAEIFDAFASARTSW